MSPPSAPVKNMMGAFFAGSHVSVETWHKQNGGKLFYSCFASEPEGAWAQNTSQIAILAPFLNKRWLMLLPYHVALVPCAFVEKVEVIHLLGKVL